MGLERMIGSKHGLFLFLLIFCVLMSTSFKLCSCINLCPEIEKQALVKFKQSLEDPGYMLSSWNLSSEENCCMWRGVVCSNLTGHVHQLRIRRPYGSQGLGGEVNPSLVNLKELKYLDLSQNNFGVMIPSFIGLLTSLEYLNLSYAGLHGRIPRSIGNLSNLHTLSLESYFTSRWETLSNVGATESWWDDDSTLSDSLEWLSGLSRLEYLNMNSVNLSKAANWVEVINMLPSLVYLHLSSCSLNSLPSSFSDVNTTSLATLDLSGNNFESFVMPTWIFQHPNLIFLDLNGCYLEGPIPSSSNTTKLKHIDLSNNIINSSIPDWLYFCKDLEYVAMHDNILNSTISKAIGNLTSLDTLILSNNRLWGTIPREIASLCKIQELDLFANMLRGDVLFGNMSDCVLEAETDLTLSENQLSSHLTRQLGEFKSLKYLNVGYNSISGAIPINIGKLSGLHYLRLDNNKLSGNLPESVGQLLNLRLLSIEHNMLEGIVTETHFSNLSKLQVLTASGNHLSLKVSSDWVPPFTLVMLTLGSWDLGVDHIPLWIETQKNVIYLDLSTTAISGNISTWIWEIPYLNLSQNNLQGQIPYIGGPEDGYDRKVYLNSNQFSGSLPQIANTVTQLDLSNNSFTTGLSHFLCDTTNQTYDLESLDLGGNQLTGELPDCLMKWPSLFVLNLAGNNLSGNLPNSIGFPENLVSINLHGNKFSGQIPFSVHNCPKLLKFDLGGNEFAGNIKALIGKGSTKLKFLILRSNKLSGEIPLEICHLNALQILDLSGNAFSGGIPKCVDNFTAMATKRSLDVYTGERRTNLSYASMEIIDKVSVGTKGREYEYNTILPLVTNIDLSNNNLSGGIPEELTRLVELRSLNFSHNCLTGWIPDNIGDMRQLESLDLSRNSLLGEMPNSFTLMSSLNYLDLSFNNLTGRIPSSTQLLSMNASSFAGNHLCGTPLPNHCGNDDQPVEAEDDKSKIEWLYVFLSLGYAVGLSAWCTGLILNKLWRDAYFGLLESIWNKIYVCFCIKWRRLTTKAQPPTS